MNAMRNGGLLLSFFGAANSAVGAYFDLSSQKIAAQSQESTLRYQQSLSQVNARIADDQALDIAAAGSREVGRQTMQAGAQKSSNRASQAASGVQLGKGSAAEAIASGDIIAKIDRYNIESNIARSVAAARMQSVNIRNQGRLAGVSADNVRATAKSINPFIGLSTSLLTGVGTLAQEWRYAQRRTS